MCTQVEVRGADGPVVCETLGELALALGRRVEDLPVYGEIGDYADAAYCCLCAVVWARMPGARKATEDEGYPFPEYIIGG